MKKIISTVAALGLVLGVAGTASALDFSISGKYVLDGVMVSGADGYGIANPYDDEAGTDSAWLHTFIVNPQLKVNDKITMFSELRMARYTNWGDQQNYSGNDNMYESDIAGVGEDRNIDVYSLYMEYLSPVGKIRAGRCIVPPWGGDFMSTTTHADRLMWWPSFVADPFTLLVFTQKSTENDWYTDNDDSDDDVYELDLTYKTDNLLLLGGYNYFNNKENSDLGPAASFDRQQHRLRAYGVVKFEPVTIEAEWGWQFGDYQDYDNEVPGVQEDTDLDAMAFMLDATAKLDKVDVGLLYFWAEGQDEVGVGEDYTVAMNSIDNGIGDDFNPYYILTGDLTGMLNSDYNAADPLMVQSGVNAVGIHSDFQVTEKLTLHGAVGYAWADTTDVLEDGLGVSVDDEYGWEVDLGAKYKLLDNLTYEVRAGYLNAGDFFEDLAETVGQESDDVYLLSNHLTMTF